MTWFLIILFASWEEYPLYVFTDPTFESKQECLTSAKDKEDVKKYVYKLLTEFGRPMPIVGVGCVNEDELETILNQIKIDFQMKEPGIAI
jgi:hypothetical protein